MTLKEAAQQASVSRMTINRWIRAGYLQTRKTAKGYSKEILSTRLPRRDTRGPKPKALDTV